MNVKEKTVGEITRGRPVYVVAEDSSVLDVARYMMEHQTGAVPILAEGYWPGIFADQVGIFSERYLMARVVAQAWSGHDEGRPGHDKGSGSAE